MSIRTWFWKWITKLNKHKFCCEKTEYNLKRETLNVTFVPGGSNDLNIWKLSFSFSLRLLSDIMWCSCVVVGRFPCNWNSCRLLMFKFLKKESDLSNMLFFLLIFATGAKPSRYRLNAVTFRVKLGRLMCAALLLGWELLVDEVEGEDKTARIAFVMAAFSVSIVGNWTLLIWLRAWMACSWGLLLVVLIINGDDDDDILGVSSKSVLSFVMIRASLEGSRLT